VSQTAQVMQILYSCSANVLAMSTAQTEIQPVYLV